MDLETSKYTAHHIPKLVFKFSWQQTPVQAVRMKHPKKLAIPAVIQTCHKIYLQMGLYPTWPYKNIPYIALSFAMTLDGASTSLHWHTHQLISHSEPEGHRWWQQVFLKSWYVSTRLYDFTFHTTVLFKCHRNLNYNIIYTANFLATIFQSPYLSELPDTWNYIFHVPFLLLFHAKNHSKCDILCDISSVWWGVVRPIHYWWWRAMTCHFQHNTLDSTLPALTTTFQWQQGLTADQFATYLYFRPCMAHIHKYILWVKQDTEKHTASVCWWQNDISTQYKCQLLRSPNNVALSWQ